MPKIHKSIIQKMKELEITSRDIGEHLGVSSSTIRASLRGFNHLAPEREKEIRDYLYLKECEDL